MQKNWVWIFFSVIQKKKKQHGLFSFGLQIASRKNVVQTLKKRVDATLYFLKVHLIFLISECRLTGRVCSASSRIPLFWWSRSQKWMKLPLWQGGVFIALLTGVLALSSLHLLIRFLSLMTTAAAMLEQQHSKLFYLLWQNLKWQKVSICKWEIVLPFDVENFYSCNIYL